MCAHFFRLLVATLVVMETAWSSHATDPLPKAELVKRGKAATALLEIQASQTGRRVGGPVFPGYTVSSTAFCVHPSGLFLTSSRVLQPLGNDPKVTLVLDAGLKTQQVFNAKVVRSDQKLDLALLRVEKEHKFAVLPLAATDEIAELTELVVFGYPRAGRRRPGGSYQAIQVHTATVNSMEREAGAVDRIGLSQLNIADGGPALGSDGKVVGMLTTAVGVVPGTTRPAVPVSHLRRFMERPDVHFQPPAISVSNQHQPIEFKARVVALIPSAKPMSLELRLRAGEQPERVYKMEADGYVYRVTTSAVPQPREAIELNLTVHYGGDSVTGLTSDRSFTLGGKKLKLSQVRELQRNTKTQARLHDGTTVEGTLVGLDAVELRLGTDKVRLNLNSATLARIEVPGAVESVMYTLVAMQDGKEIGRVHDTILIQGVASKEKRGTFVPEKLTRKLPAAIEDVAVGGNGRFLILHLPKVRKLAIFDAQTAKVTRFLDFTDEKLLFTAGLDKLLVIVPEKKQMQRWDLLTGEREQTAPIPFKGVVKAVCMGSAAPRLVLMHGAAGTQPLDPAFLHFMDIRTMKLVDSNPIRNHFFFSQYRVTLHLRAAPGGSVYGMWSTSGSPQGFQTVVVNDGMVKVHYEHTDTGFLVPSADGKAIFTGRGLYTLEGKPKNGPVAVGYTPLLPASGGHYYLSISPREGGPAPYAPFNRSEPPAERKAGVSIHLLGDTRPLLTLPDIPVVDIRPSINNDFTEDKRLHFLPEHKLLVAIPAASDELLLYRFDLLDALDKSGLDYLFVASQPPGSARSGASFTYQMEVKSKCGGLKYKVESGPRNLAISPKGKITWQAPEGAEAEVPVIVSVQDASGQECFHAFTLRIVD